jgi:hypothetical protein
VNNGASNLELLWARCCNVRREARQAFARAFDYGLVFGRRSTWIEVFLQQETHQKHKHTQIVAHAG